MAGKIRKLLENELVGGAQSNDVYPVTSIKAVYDEDNERLDNVINRRGVVNISTNYNSDHIAEVLTLEQAIAKVPSKDRVLGFQGKFQTSEGWKSYIFTGDSVSNWSDISKWIEILSSAVLAQELGDSTSKAISQDAVTKEINSKRSNIFLGGIPMSKRFVEAGMFYFVIDAYFDLDYDDENETKFYYLGGIDKSTKRILLYKKSRTEIDPVILITFSSIQEKGSLSLMTSTSSDKSFIIVDWNLWKEDSVLGTTLYSEGVALNPILFRTKVLYDLLNNSDLTNSILLNNGYSILFEKDTISQSYLTENGVIKSSDAPSTTVGVYDVTDIKAVLLRMQTGNQYTTPYKFYNSAGDVVPDINTSPVITNNGINLSINLVVPEDATTLKITYNNTYNHSINEVNYNFVLTSLFEKKISDIDKDLNYTGKANIDTITFDAQYQQKKLKNIIPSGYKVELSGDVTQITCRTNAGDSDYQTITNGTIADRDINYVKNATVTGEVTISAIGGQLGLKPRVDELEKEVDTLKNGYNFSEEISFTAQWQQKPLSSTIPKGYTIRLSGEVSQITCRTNAGDSTYQTVTDGTIADRDINYVKSGYVTGSVTISVSILGLLDCIKEINVIKSALGYSENALQEQETLSKSYLKPDGSIGDSNTASTTVGVYNIEGDDVSEIALEMQTGNQYTTPYKFYDADGVVVSDDNTFPTITDNGIYYLGSLLIPKGAKVFKITYNNTVEHSVSLVQRNFVSKLEFNNLVKKTESLEDSINASKEGTGVAYRVSSKFMLRPLKILAVGNSWTMNATNFLGSILTSLGVKVMIDYSYAGGAPLSSYWSNLNTNDGNTAAFVHGKWRDGSGWNTEDDKQYSYKDIFLSDDWDIVAHQQQSGNGGNYPSFQPYLHNILQWEKTNCKVMPLFFMHATWSYPNDNTNEGNLVQFEELYGSDSDTMYNAILNAYNQAMVDENIVNVMPSAPIIQQIRTLSIENIDTTDGSHLGTSGQFAVACVWAEMLLRNYFDQSVASELSIINSTYRPGGVSEEDASTIKTLAKTIVQDVRTYFPAQQ